MKTGNKITLFYTLITISVIALVSVTFYFVSTNYITRLYYSYLTEKAYATAEKHWEKDEVDPESYARIQQRYEETLPVATEILLNADSVVETRAALTPYLTENQITKLYEGNVITFSQGLQVGAAVYYPDNEGNFIVLVISSNQYGGDIQKRIGWLLFVLIVISIILVYFVGKLYAIRMVDRIDAAYQSEKSFISNASHELNNPLTAIQGECEISLLKERTPDEYQAALKRIASETKRIIQLMKHLLFLSHGDKEILKNATERVYLADFLFQFASNRVCFSADDYSLAIDANPYLLKIAISNIISNACKYSGNEIVDMRLHDNILEIEDQGIGIPAEELNRIYQPFFRASNTREYAGHGIGLALSLRILNTYGAKVRITSIQDKGTKVSIEFCRIF
ncbi:sensor histidine kinase [Parabacteroides bouchesdurhonensis]|uniref:sensor histidine kinase n=1 Tax=Parabacteroides bouchesdurhonensis TaxID=1936995 RepID=UPI000E47F0CE|nr:HAMP domain-containing sensor histidine kinase [Parabacteroides bouchesdurhonensis]RHJ91380.1 sensor histidine kinase [Bacteroides sp. AM07-16]